MRARRLVGRAALLAAVCFAAGPALPQTAPLRIYGMESKPVSFMGAAGPDGITVEVAQHIQQRLGRSDPVEVVPWSRANTIAMHQPNVLLLSIIRTPERERRFTLVGPVFVGYISVYARKDRAAAIRAMGDGIYKLRGGARRGSVFVERARSLGYNVTDEPVSSEVAARMLMMRRFDLWFDGEQVIGHSLAVAGYALSDVEKLRQLSTEDVNFAFSAGTPLATVQAWDAALREMKRDGSFQKIHRKWLPHYPLPADARAADGKHP